jgi:ferredoxin
VSVDRTLCRGTGLCEVMDSRLFRLDDEGIAVALPVDDDSHDTRLERLHEAADCCPTGAITVSLIEERSRR